MSDGEEITLESLSNELQYQETEFESFKDIEFEDVQNDIEKLKDQMASMAKAINELRVERGMKAEQFDFLPWE